MTRIKAAALLVGSVVCIASANAGATSQDLKTGYLVGATPYKQQIGLIIGVLVSVLAIGGTLLLLDRSVPGLTHAIGSERFPAPQAVLMSTMIKGQLSQQLPWGPVLVGVALAFVAQLAGANARCPGPSGPTCRCRRPRRSSSGPGALAGHAAAQEAARSSWRCRCRVGYRSGHAVCDGPGRGWLAGRHADRVFAGFADPLARRLDLGHEYWNSLGLRGDFIAFGVFTLLAVVLVRQAMSKVPRL